MTFAEYIKQEARWVLIVSGSDVLARAEYTGDATRLVAPRDVTDAWLRFLGADERPLIAHAIGWMRAGDHATVTDHGVVSVYVTER